MVWGYDQIKVYVQSSLEEKLKDVPKEHIKPPSPEIAVPTLETMRYAGYIEELREMFSNLLATSMNEMVSEKAHPSFVEIIKQLHSNEARLLNTIKENSHPLISVKSKQNDRSYLVIIENFTNLDEKSNDAYGPLIFSYLENLKRLGLISISKTASLTPDILYDELIKHPVVTQAEKVARNIGMPEITKGHLSVTPFGKMFYQACINEK